jgi:hypothetical protein
LASARLWLETDALPETCHFVVRERLASWIAAVEAGGPEIRAALLAVIPPIEPRLPVPVRGWIMPSGKGVRAEPDPAEPASPQTAEITSYDPHKSSTFSGLDGRNPPLTGKDTGTAFSEDVEAREVNNSAKPPFAADDLDAGGPTGGAIEPGEEPTEAKPPPRAPASYPPGWEFLTDLAEIRKKRRGFPSVFEAEWWGEPAKLPPYPAYPTGKVSGIALAKYRARLLPTIRARSAPVLLPAKVALAALRIDKAIPDNFDPRRRPAWWPKWLPVARHDGEWWVERDELREHLFPEEYLGSRPACPITVPRCRYCGRLSHRGWADQICDRCESIRTGIETAQMSRHSIATRRGWTGPALSTDDELMLAIQRRLTSADRTEWANAREEEGKAARQKRRDRGAEPDEAEEPGAAEEEALDERAVVDLAEAA